MPNLSGQWRRMAILVGKVSFGAVDLLPSKLFQVPVPRDQVPNDRGGAERMKAFLIRSNLA